MFNLKIVLLLTIVSSSLFVDCNGNGDVYGAWRNAFSTKFDQIVELIDQQRQSVVIEERRSPVENHYDDAKCYSQMMILMRAFNASEMWAFKGNSNDENESMINSGDPYRPKNVERSAIDTEFCAWIFRSNGIILFRSRSYQFFT